MQNPQATPVVDIDQITLCYGSTQVVSDFSLQVCPGEVHALAGENGAGKTTVLKAIAGLLNPSKGSIVIPRDVVNAAPCVAFVLQHDALPVNMTAGACIQCASVSTTNKSTLESVHQWLDRVGLITGPGVLVSTLTMHQRQLLQLACALAMKPSILLLDEPTAVMSQPDAMDFWKLIKSEVAQGLTVVIATHKLEDIIQYCSHVTVMRAGVNVFTKPTDDVNLQTIVKGMSPASSPLLESDHAYDACARELPIIEVDSGSNKLVVYANEVHGVAGLDGSGYGKWLDAVALVPVEGLSVSVDGMPIDHFSVRERRAIGIGYVPADRHADAVIGTESLTTNMCYGALPTHLRQWWKPVPIQKNVCDAVSIVNEYDVRPPDVIKLMHTFSGGNQQKFLVGREIERNNRIMVINQPTRGLDRSSSALIGRKIRQVSRRPNGAVLLYSDDLSFLMHTCDTISTVSGGTLTKTRPSSDWTEESLVEAII